MLARAARHVRTRSTPRRFLSDWWDDFHLLREPSHAEPASARLATFERWLRAAGARFDGLALRADAATGVAGHARRDLAAGEPVVSLPLDCLIAVPDARACCLLYTSPSPRD